ncbi:MAG: SpoIIIAH-like family protein [Erysipelotrichaceae bacterium]|nr:SpoIIIAH-like family protein [Erysipelotrichaceae bacterium]
MMNKKNLWFLTLFSLVLVLSIYYVTMPSDLLAASTSNTNTNSLTDQDISVNVTESDVIAALKVEDDSKTNDTLSELQEKLTNAETSTEEKNTLYEQIKTINTNSGLEESIEKKINSTYQCEAFTKIEDTSVKVVVDKCENSKSLANNIMRLVQEQFEEKMYISVQFES